MEEEGLATKELEGGGGAVMQRAASAECYQLSSGGEQVSPNSLRQIHFLPSGNRLNRPGHVEFTVLLLPTR
ncbi:hypothetical protein INR49_008018 [Caranx melampygus]|nr:hypothetical protein INR49_008018 [Caranx melampygus]